MKPPLTLDRLRRQTRRGPLSGMWGGSPEPFTRPGAVAHISRGSVSGPRDYATLEDRGGRGPIYPAPPRWSYDSEEPVNGLHDLSEPDLDALSEIFGAPTSAESGHGDGPTDRVGIRGLVLSQDTVDAVCRVVPGLEDPDHLGLALHSVLSTNIHQSTDRGGNVYRRVKIGAGTLARLQGMQKEYGWKKYGGEGFLEAHRAALPEFVWTKHRKGEYPRQVRAHGLPDAVVDLIEDDLVRPLEDLERPVYADGHTTFYDPKAGRGARDHARRRARALVKAKLESHRAVCPLQARLLGLLNATPSHGISRLVRANVAEAIAVAAEVEDRDERLRALAAVRLAQLQPQPFYAPSRRGASVRVFAVGHSVLSLKSQVRKALMRGCLEADLVNAHLAIAARLLGVDALVDVLYDADGRPRKAWPYLLSAAGFGHLRPGNPDYADVKAALKEAVYALVYGMSVRGLRWLLGRSLSPEAADLFLSDPVVRDLLEARDRKLTRITMRGGERDCFGVFHVADGETAEERERAARSVLSRLAQAIELKLLEPVIEDAIAEDAKGRPEYRIVGWQHDGFTVAVRRNGGRVRRRLERLVEERAAELDIPTFLETEWLEYYPLGRAMHFRVGHPSGVGAGREPM